MTDMEHAIEQASRVLASKWQNVSTNESLGKQRMLARALAEAGLLAPAPLREEWGYMEPGGEVWSSTVPGEDTRVRRYVTDWEEA